MTLKLLKEVIKQTNESLDFLETYFPPRTPLENVSSAVLRLQQEIDNIEVPQVVGEDRIHIIINKGLTITFEE